MTRPTVLTYWMTILATDHTVAELSLPQFDARALLRRGAPAALLAAGAVAVVVLVGGRVHGFLDAIGRVLDVSPGWAVAAVAFEFLSLAGYIALLALVAGRATGRIGTRESAQITFAGAAVTRLLPTAGAGGVALALWALRRAGLPPRAATRTLLVFMVVLYSVFLVAIVASGAMLALGAVHAGTTAHLAVVPALAALGAIAIAVGLGLRPGAGAGARACAPARSCWGTRCARRRRWSGSETHGYLARSAIGRSMRPFCGRCCARSAPRPRCPSWRSRTSSDSSRTRCRYRGR